LDRNFDFTTPDPPCGRVTRLLIRSILRTEDNITLHSPPNYAYFRPLHFALSLVNKGDALRKVRRPARICSEEEANLSKVKLSILLGCYPLDLYK